jgi:hypothetical protein
MMRRSQRVKAIVPGLLLALALALASCAPTPPPRVEIATETIRAWVGGPMHLTEVDAGEVPVLCIAFAKAGVTQVGLLVNGSLVGTANAAGETYFTTQLSFRATDPGSYELRCQTQDQTGQTVRSEPVTVIVTGEAAPPPEETATPTETEEASPTVAAPPPTGTPVRPTATPVPPTATPVRPTATPVPPTATRVPPTATPIPPRPTILSFEASPATVEYGGCTRLSWQVRGVIEQVRLGGPQGEGVGHDDFRDRCQLTQTTTYLLWAKGPGGETTAQLTVVVTQAPGDTQGPTISQITWATSPMSWPDAECTSGTPNEVHISATIADPSEVSGAKVVYRVLRGGVEGEWRNVPMSELRGRYQVTITGEHLQASSSAAGFDPAGAEQNGTLRYYIQAFDGVDNSAQSPWGSATIQYCYFLR